VFKAVQMIEALRGTRGGLRVEDFLDITGYSRSTIYRILRTLSACDYVVRASEGVYRLNFAVVAAADAARRTTEEGDQFGRHPQTNDRHLGFERWGIQFRSDGTRMNIHPRKTQEIVPQAVGTQGDRSPTI
jgi:hypothetical protein